MWIERCHDPDLAGHFKLPDDHNVVGSGCAIALKKAVRAWLDLLSGIVKVCTLLVESASGWENKPCWLGANPKPRCAWTGGPHQSVATESGRTSRHTLG